MSKFSSKAPAQLLAIKSQALLSLEQNLSDARLQLQQEENTLTTLRQYIEDYSSINGTDWKNSNPEINKTPVGAVPRLKNGSRFLANLQIALHQQQVKIDRSRDRYHELMKIWQIKKQEKQKLSDLVAEKKQIDRLSYELKQEQIENDDWVNRLKF